MDEEPNVWPTLVQCGGDGWLVTMMVMYLDKAWWLREIQMVSLKDKFMHDGVVTLVLAKS